jgi:hypothetical protein
VKGPPTRQSCLEARLRHQSVIYHRRIKAYQRRIQSKSHLLPVAFAMASRRDKAQGQPGSHREAELTEDEVASAAEATRPSKPKRRQATLYDAVAGKSLLLPIHYSICLAEIRARPSFSGT